MTQPAKELGLGMEVPTDARELAFHNMMEHLTLPPCSLDDFMDYLVHIEKKAENLQFFLWFIDYLGRWRKMCPTQRFMSKPWKHSNPVLLKDDATAPAITTLKVEEILSKLDSPNSEWNIESKMQYDPPPMSPVPNPVMPLRTASGRGNHSRRPSVDTAVASPEPLANTRGHIRRPSDATVIATSPLSPLGSNLGRWRSAEGRKSLKYTIQPFRDEFSRIVRHYISPLNSSTPRPLLYHISPAVRAEIHRAAQGTTHPSALLPAAEAAEKVIRDAHPRFVRWAAANANAPRLWMWRVVGALMIALGCLIVILTSRLTTLSNGVAFAYYAAVAMSAFLLWVPGTLVATAAWQGVCVERLIRRSRDARPWEALSLLEMRRKDGRMEEEGRASCEQPDKALDFGGGASGWKRGHYRNESSIASQSSFVNKMQPDLRKTAMQMLGPTNESETADMKAWGRMSYWRRVNPPQVAVPEESAVRRHQRKVVTIAGATSLVVTFACFVGSYVLGGRSGGL